MVVIITTANTQIMLV